VEAQVDTDTPGEITITFAEPQEGYAEIS